MLAVKNGTKVVCFWTTDSVEERSRLYESLGVVEGNDQLMRVLEFSFTEHVRSQVSQSWFLDLGSLIF